MSAALDASQVAINASLHQVLIHLVNASQCGAFAKLANLKPSLGLERRLTVATELCEPEFCTISCKTEKNCILDTLATQSSKGFVT